MKHHIMSRAHKSNIRRSAPILLALAILASGLGFGGLPSLTGAHAQAAAASARTPAEQEMFGMVMRDPFYEYNTDPVHFPQAANRTALERQAAELEAAGVKWVRMEFFADYDGSVQAGDINFAKYDWFIRDCAPRHGLKILALLNVGMVAYQGQTLRTLAFNDPPDRAGTDPDDGSNHFIRVFTARAQVIAARYGEAISAYEIINEPNISYDLWLDSRNSSAEIKPERYAALLSDSYWAIKGVNPKAQVIVGGLMIGSPPEGKNHDQFDYLYQLYVSQWVDRYRSKGYSSRPGWNVVPWDGVALHPYFLDTPKLFQMLEEFARKLQDRGDPTSKLWITEIGEQAQPALNPADPPTDAEIAQASYLRSVYSGILDDPALSSIVAHTFWFKYEDFVPGNYTHNYGVVRLMESPDHLSYDPAGRVWVHKLAYKAYQELALGYAPTDPLDPAPAQADGQIYFAETGQAIAPQFADYWQNNGALGRFGYPLTRPVMIGGILSQFFERAVFEYHPEYAGTANAVLLRLLGDEVTSGRDFPAADTAALTPDRFYFPQTGHSLGGVFLAYWQANGGLAVYGYPISEEIVETSATDGKPYTVQYFERNRFERHPENAGTPFEVELGLLGADMLKSDRWWR